MIMTIHDMTDIHCHILPNVDDGPKVFSLALRMLKKEYEDGVRRVILTPHYRRGMFETKESVIEAQFERFREEAETVCDVKLALGCEFHANMDMVDRLLAKKRPTLAGSDYVLAEFSGDSTFTYIKERCASLMDAGFHPVIAHAERYRTLRELDHLEEIVEMGAYIQMNAQSIIGDDGFFTARFCHKAIDAQLVHIVASDAHDMKKRPPCMKECAEVLVKKHGSYVARDLLEYYPGEIWG